MSNKLRTQMIASSIAFLCSMPRGEGLELSYENKDAIPAGYEELYSEKDGKMVLTGVKGMKTENDVTTLQTALQKERQAHKALKTQFAPLASHGSIEDIVASLDRIPELEAGQGKGANPADIDKLVQAKLAPLQRELDTVKTTLIEKDNEISTYKGKEQKATIAEQVRKAAKGLKVRDTAIEDAVMYGQNLLTVDEAGNVVTKENSGVTPFVSAEEMLRDLLQGRPHWLEESVGGGAQGGKGGMSGENPYSHENWNLGEQMRIYKENPAKAQALAKRHGVDPLKPTRPAKK